MSKQIELKFIEMIDKMIQIKKEEEFIKKTVKKQKDFIPLMAFKKIKFNDQDNIFPEDIKRFLAENEMVANLENIELYLFKRKLRSESFTFEDFCSLFSYHKNEVIIHPNIENQINK